MDGERETITSPKRRREEEKKERKRLGYWETIAINCRILFIYRPLQENFLSSSSFLVSLLFLFKEKDKERECLQAIDFLLRRVFYLFYSRKKKKKFFSLLFRYFYFYYSMCKYGVALLLCSLVFFNYKRKKKRAFYSSTITITSCTCMYVR